MQNRTSGSKREEIKGLKLQATGHGWAGLGWAGLEERVGSRRQKTRKTRRGLRRARPGQASRNRN